MESIIAENMRIEAQTISETGGPPSGGPWEPAGQGIKLDPYLLNMKEAVKQLEVHLINTALEQTHGNQLKAAKKLGISREGLRKKVARYEMRPEDADST